MLEARAIENLAYTIGVNRVGDDEKGNHYTGDSRVVDYSGKVLYQVTEVEDTFTVALSKNQQEAFRNNFLFLADRDHFEIK